MTSLCLWLTGGAVILAGLIGWALGYEFHRVGDLAMPDEADMNDGANVPAGPFFPLREGVNPGDAFNCPRWPDCGCPDGAVRTDCPGLQNRRRG